MRHDEHDFKWAVEQVAYEDKETCEAVETYLKATLSGPDSRAARELIERLDYLLDKNVNIFNNNETEIPEDEL